jgi:protocatechuate 3,4-dioxygenase beta subunit
MTRINLSRREFLGSVAIGAAAAAVAGCGGDGGTSGAPDGALADADPARPDADPSAPDGGYTPACEETEDDIEGPFYRAGAPERANIVPDGAPGVRLHLTGTVSVRSAAGVCTLLSGAVLDFWQANDAGAYDSSAEFLYRGKVTTAEDGSFALETIIPGHYLNGNQYRPAHIHVKANGQGTTLLTTQLYFEGDEFNEIDPWFDPVLAMALEDDGQGGKNATFDFVLRPA